nr:hypothetical protein BJQ95_02058 [Cryobacterium sp. SO1]
MVPILPVTRFRLARPASEAVVTVTLRDDVDGTHLELTVTNRPSCAQHRHHHVEQPPIRFTGVMTRQSGAGVSTHQC